METRERESVCVCRLFKHLCWLCVHSLDRSGFPTGGRLVLVVSAIEIVLRASLLKKEVLVPPLLS